MRNIRFRAWDKEDKEMFRVISISWPHEYSKSKEISVIVCGRGGCIYNPILMQFTGLLDKNGKEIYEGDIVEVSGNINFFKEQGEIVFEHGCFFFDGRRFTPKHLTMYPRDLLCECQTTFYTQHTPPEIPLTKFAKVIGNIYENPDLLKGAL